MNKNGDSATMYRTIPAVAGLNKVEGFDPSSLLGSAISTAAGEEGQQLGLAYKKLWFRLAYPGGAAPDGKGFPDGADGGV